jgi:glycosyltransferase involved in cell wall biosynthesis
VKPKKRILFISHNHPAVRPGGAEGHALDLHEALRAAGEFEPVFMARMERADQPSALRSRIPIASVDGRPGHYFLYTDWSDWDWIYERSSDRSVLTRFFRDFLLAQRPAVIHFQHTRFLGYDMVRIARNTLPETPIFYTLHDYLPICHNHGQMVRTSANELCEEESPRRCHECFPSIAPQTFFMRKRFIQSQLLLVDCFIAPSEYVRQRYMEWGIPPERIEVVPYARPAVSRPPEPSVERPRNRFAFFGQFTPYKGADVLLEAMANLGNDFDGHLWFHAANLEIQPPEFQEKIKALLELTEKTVTIAGPYEPPQLGKLLSEIDWVMVPSIWWETGPLVVLEAFQYGRPVIASDIGGMSEKVEDGVSGLHFRTGDPDSLAEVIKKAAETPGLWERLHDGIPPVYPIEDHASEMVKHYNRLISERAVTSNGVRTQEPDFIANTQSI